MKRVYTDPFCGGGVRTIDVLEATEGILGGLRARRADGTTLTLLLRGSTPQQAVLELLVGETAHDLSTDPRRAVTGFVGDSTDPYIARQVLTALSEAVPAELVRDFPEPLEPTQRLLVACSPLLRCLRSQRSFTVPEQLPTALLDVFTATSPQDAVTRLLGAGNRPAGRALSDALTAGGALNHRSVSMARAGHGLPPDYLPGLLQAANPHDAPDRTVTAAQALTASRALRKLGNRNRHFDALAALIAHHDGVVRLRQLSAAEQSGQLDLAGVTGSDLDHLEERVREALVDHLASTGEGVDSLHGRPTGNPRQRFRVARSASELKHAGQVMDNCLRNVRPRGTIVLVVNIDHRGVRHRHAIEVDASNGVTDWKGPRNRPPAAREKPAIEAALKRAGIDPDPPARRVGFPPPGFPADFDPGDPPF